MSSCLDKIKLISRVWWPFMLMVTTHFFIVGIPGAFSQFAVLFNPPSALQVQECLQDYILILTQKPVYFSF